MRNKAILGNKMIREGLRQLRGRLPPGWNASLTTEVNEPGPDAWLEITAPDERVGRLAIEAKRRLEPRGVLTVAAELRRVPGAVTHLVLAPYLSPAVRARLREASLGFLDLTGNAWIELREPGLFIESEGADTDPDRTGRPSRSLRGPKAGRIVRALIDSKDAPGVRQLAEETGVDPGYVSRVLALLDREALVERAGRGRITSVDWARLLRRWAEEAPLESRAVQLPCLEPRGLGALQSRVGALNQPYAITGSLAVARRVSIAPPRLAMLYVEDRMRAASELGLRPTDTGANVVLLEAGDVGVYSGVTVEEGLSFAAPSQVAADLLTSSGRGPQEGEELIEWMRSNEGLWRG